MSDKEHCDFCGDEFEVGSELDTFQGYPCCFACADDATCGNCGIIGHDVYNSDDDICDNCREEEDEEE